MGHALRNDLKVSGLVIWFYFSEVKMLNFNLKYKQVLLLSHPKQDLRDTLEYQPFQK